MPLRVASLIRWWRDEKKDLKESTTVRAGEAVCQERREDDARRNANKGFWMTCFSKLLNTQSQVIGLPYYVRNFHLTLKKAQILM